MGPVRPGMENIQFEITHERIVSILAKHLDVQPEQIRLDVVSVPIAGEETIAAGVKAVVRTDLPTANKIERKLKRLDGEVSDQPQE